MTLYTMMIKDIGNFQNHLQEKLQKIHLHFREKHFIKKKKKE